MTYGVWRLAVDLASRWRARPIPSLRGEIPRRSDGNRRQESLRRVAWTSPNLAPGGASETYPELTQRDEFAPFAAALVTALKPSCHQPNPNSRLLPLTVWRQGTDTELGRGRTPRGCERAGRSARQCTRCTARRATATTKKKKPKQRMTMTGYSQTGRDPLGWESTGRAFAPPSCRPIPGASSTPPTSEGREGIRASHLSSLSHRPSAPSR